MNELKRVCFFGIFNPEYIRNKVLSIGFEENGFEVVLITANPAVGKIKKYRSLYKQYKALENKNFTYVIVAWPGWSIVWLARLLFGEIIFDAFMSVYNSNVEDRKLYSKWHPLGIRDYIYDWYSCRLSKKVLLPEKVHVEYFKKTFNLSANKFIQIYTGANDKIFTPQMNVGKAEEFTVHFHGNFVPLHGVEYIIEAANILKDEPIYFQIIGSGGELYDSTKKKVADLGLVKVSMLGRKSLEEVPKYIARAHLCLGVFGSTNKTQLVISNKIYECIAVGMPVITSKTPATEELFIDRENILFVNAKDGKDLAEKIILLKNNPELGEKIARNGRELFVDFLTPKKLVAKLIGTLPSGK